MLWFVCSTLNGKKVISKNVLKQVKVERGAGWHRQHTNTEFEGMRCRIPTCENMKFAFCFCFGYTFGRLLFFTFLYIVKKLYIKEVYGPCLSAGGLDFVLRTLPALRPRRYTQDMMVGLNWLHISYRSSYFTMNHHPFIMNWQEWQLCSQAGMTDEQQEE